MFCPKCGGLLPDDAQCCMRCGQVINSAVSTPASIPQAKPRRKITWYITGPVVLFGIWFVYVANQAHHTDQQQQLRYHPQLYTTKVGTGTLTVNASTFSYYTIQVPSNATNVNLKGHYKAMGGSGNDVEVYLLSEDQYTNWQNGHSTPTYYNGGRMTVGDIDANLPNNSGTYYLVFNNKLSLLSPKAVEENVALTYYK